MQSFDPPEQLHTSGLTDLATERSPVVSLDSIIQVAQEGTAMRSNTSDELKMSSHLLQLEKGGMATINDVGAHIDDALSMFLSDRSGLGSRVQLDAKNLQSSGVPDCLLAADLETKCCCC